MERVVYSLYLILSYHKQGKFKHVLYVHNVHIVLRVVCNLVLRVVYSWYLMQWKYICTLPAWHANHSIPLIMRGGIYLWLCRLWFKRIIYGEAMKNWELRVTLRIWRTKNWGSHCVYKELWIGRRGNNTEEEKYKQMIFSTFSMILFFAVYFIFLFMISMALTWLYLFVSPKYIR